MPVDPAGNYTLPPQYFAEPGQVIRTTQHNPPLEDIAAALSAVMWRDGRGGVTANLSMYDYRITDLARGSAPTDAARVSQLMPVGSVIDFAGAVAPDGWLFCYGQAISRTDFSVLFTMIGTTYGVGDGSSTFNVPDCRGRVAAGKDDMGGTAAGRLTAIAGPLGSAGGAQTVAMTEAQMPEHTHGATTASGGVHSHTGTAASGGAHVHTASAEAAGAHTHTLPTYTSGFGGSRAGTFTSSDGSNLTTSSSGSHTHDVDVVSGGAHTHALTIADGGAHTHAMTVLAAGTGAAHPNLQPTIVFNKIIKAVY